MNPDTRCPFTLKAVLTWPKSQSVYSPKIKAMMDAINGGSIVPQHRRHDTLSLDIQPNRE